MKESHFELPRSCYMESESQNSKRACGGLPTPQFFGFASENGETNDGSAAHPFSPQKKIVSWETVLQECDMNTPASYTQIMLHNMSAPVEEGLCNGLNSSKTEHLYSTGASGSFNYSFGQCSSPPQLPGMNSIMSFLMRESLHVSNQQQQYPQQAHFSFSPGF